MGDVRICPHFAHGSQSRCLQMVGWKRGFRGVFARLLTITPSRLEVPRRSDRTLSGRARRGDEAQSGVCLLGLSHSVEVADSRLESSRVERDRDGIEILLEQVGVHVEGNAGLGMAEHSLHRFDVRSG